MGGQRSPTVPRSDPSSCGPCCTRSGYRNIHLSDFPSCSAPQLQDSRVLRACSFNLGAAYVETGQPEIALDFLHRAQPGPKADRLPDLQFNLALAHNAMGQSQEAAVYFLQAAQLYRSQGDGGSEGDACMEMSRCHSRVQVRPRTRAGPAADRDRCQDVCVCCRTGPRRFRVSCGLLIVTEWRPCWILQPMPSKRQEVT